MIQSKHSLILLALIPIGACSQQVAYLRSSTPTPAPVMDAPAPALSLPVTETPVPALSLPVTEGPKAPQPDENWWSQDDQDPFGDAEESVSVEWFKAGYYAGVKFGKSELDTSSGDLNDALIARGYSTTTDLENDDSTFSLYGGYRFAEPFSVELAWVNLGQVESEISATPANLNVFLNDVADVHPYLGKGINVKGIYHVLDRERIQLGVSLGVWFWNADVQAEAASGQLVNIDESGVDLNYGLQALVPLGNSFSAVFAWERFMLDDNEADTIWVGVQGAL